MKPMRGRTAPPTAPPQGPSNLWARWTHVEYLSPGGTQHSFRNRWQHLNNDNDNDQSNLSNVFYSEYQFQQRGEAWGVEGLVVTGGGTN